MIGAPAQASFAVEDTYGEQGVKLPAGDMVVDPGTKPARCHPGHAQLRSDVRSAGRRLAGYASALARQLRKRCPLTDRPAAWQPLASMLLERAKGIEPSYAAWEASTAERKF